MRRMIVVVLLLLKLPSCKRNPRSDDAAFTGVQQRGQMAMGVDQYTSAHRFEMTPDGGRISLERESDDSLGIAQIRAHMKLIQHAFAAGDFSTPAFVHQREMPGAAVLASKRDVITYGYEELPRGGAVVIRTRDADARKALEQFFAAQRTDHHSR
jgi:hypothetical protein